MAASRVLMLMGCSLVLLLLLSLLSLLLLFMSDDPVEVVEHLGVVGLQTKEFFNFDLIQKSAEVKAVMQNKI